MKKPIFEHSPLLPPALSLAAGIAVGCKLLLTGGQVLALLAAVVAATLLLSRRPLLQSVATWACFFVLGLAVAPGETSRVADGTLAEAVVVSPVAERPKTLMTDLLLTATGERRRCYIWKDSLSRQLQPGDALLARFSHGQFVGPADWRPDGSGLSRVSPLQRLRLRALRWREGALQRLHVTGADADAQAVVAAMVLGDKRALTRELRDVYTVSGASHVLALSGLHLSIIYLLLTRLSLGRRRFWAGQVLTVVALWAYALLTGLSPSLVRAATMLSVYALFALGGRRHAPLGVLSFTAIVMLLADGSALFDLGFQLSFLAMLGILLFVPRFDALTARRPAMGRSGWRAPLRWLGGVVGVSVAAQLGTAPLVAFCFGRFSTWFLLTNLVVIPLATLVLYGALLVLLFPAAAPLLLSVVGAMNAALTAISRLPWASIGPLQPSALQVVLAYVVIAVVYALLCRLTAHRSR